MFKLTYLHPTLLKNVISNKSWKTVYIRDFETFFKLGSNSCEFVFSRSFERRTKIPMDTQYEVYSDNHLLAIFNVTEDMLFYPNRVFNLHWLADWKINLSTIFRHFERA